MDASEFFGIFLYITWKFCAKIQSSSTTNESIYMQTDLSLAITEAVIKSILQEIGPKNFSIALHNASSYGAVFNENFSDYLDEDDKFLKGWYEGIDQLNKASK